jgi:hypothetical protein
MKLYDSANKDDVFIEIFRLKLARDRGANDEVAEMLFVGKAAAAAHQDFEIQ